MKEKMAKNEVKCPFCDALMKFSHCVNFKVDIGTKDTDLVLLLPKTNECILPLDIFVCSNCGGIQFFASKEIKDSLLRVASARVQDP